MLTDSQRKLAADNIKLAYKFARTHGYVTDDEDAQEACVSLCRAAQDYDKGTGFKFSNFATIYMKHDLARRLQIAGRQKRTPGKQVSLNKEIGDDGETPLYVMIESHNSRMEDGIEEIEKRDFCKSLFKNLQKKLSRQDMNILMCLIQNSNMSVVAEKVGLSKESIRLHRNRIRKIAEETILEMHADPREYSSGRNYKCRIRERIRAKKTA